MGYVQPQLQVTWGPVGITCCSVGIKCGSARIMWDPVAISFFLRERERESASKGEWA